MDEHEHLTTGAKDGVGDLLTPKASAITAFALAVLSMTGQGTWTQAVQALWGPSFPQSQIGSVLASAAAATLLLAVAAFLVARRALAGSAPDSWEAHLARAGVIVAGVATVLSSVTVLMSLLRWGL